MEAKAIKYLGLYALIAGILAIVFSFMMMAFFIVAIIFVCLAILLGIFALYNIKKVSGTTTDKTFAWIGIILGVVSIVLLIIGPLMAY